MADYDVVVNGIALNKTISPRDLAKAIGTSESSLKRWADQGLLQVTRTGGGHRRITLKAAIKFIRDRSLAVLDPASIGLPAGLDTQSAQTASASDFLSLLEDGKFDSAQNLLMSLFIYGVSVAEIGDSYIKFALGVIGDGVHTPELILSEHRATQTCIEVIQKFSQSVSLDRPRFTATGASFSKDPYILPSMLVALTLEEQGGHAANIGPNTPIEVLRCATTSLEPEQRPDLAWISISSVDDIRSQTAQINRFAWDCHECGILLAVGGRDVGQLALDHVPSMTLHASLKSIGDLAATI